MIHSVELLGWALFVQIFLRDVVQSNQMRPFPRDLVLMEMQQVTHNC